MASSFRRAVLLAGLGLLPLTSSIVCAENGAEAWVRRYSHPVSADDFVSQTATGSDGSIVVAGYTRTGDVGDDWLIVKYTGAGVPLWTNHYNGSMNGDDQAKTVAVDGNGNVLVSGSSYNGTNLDYASVKYSSMGVPLWTNRYDGAGGGDLAQAVAVNAGGDVLFAGYSSNGTNNDYAIISYSGAGVPLWTNRYNGPANSTDQAQAIAVDTSGNAFVLGTSSGSGTFDDYATIAYSGAGVPLWTNRYNGPANSGDLARAIGVDINGNVFVAGYSYDPVVGFDFATIAYSGAGGPLWTNRYNGPGNNRDEVGALALDAGGNVYVTGYSFVSGSREDFATVAYSGAGLPLWTNRYNGPSNSWDIAAAIAVDGSGNVIVSGNSDDPLTGSTDYATVAYSNTGLPLWTNRYDGPGSGSDMVKAVVVGTNGNILISGSSVGSSTANDFATIAYSGAGVPLWTNSCNEPGNGSDQARAVVANSIGRIFVAGYSFNNGTGDDFATVGYTDAGTPLWTNRYDGPGNSEDQAHTIAKDSSGRIFVAGHSFNGSDNDYATIAYSDAGVPLWTNRYNGPANGDDRAQAIAVSLGGNVYVCGYSAGAGTGPDFATLAYSGAGVPLWTNRYNGPGNSFDKAYAMTVDTSGNVFVSGYAFDPVTGNDYATIAYSGTGVPLWTNRYNAPFVIGDDVVQAIAVGPAGNVFVTGYSGYGTGPDYATIAYSGAGVPLWTNRYNGPGDDSDRAQAIAVDGDGNVFVSGLSVGVGINTDYATVAYSGVGLPLWTNRYNGPSNHSDNAQALIVDNSGRVYVSGFSYGTDTFEDYATIAYSGAGVRLWTNRYDGPVNGSDRVPATYSLALAPDGLVVIGSSDRDWGSAETTDFAVVKYTIAGPPVITSQPLSAVTTCSAGSASFTVSAVGSPPLAYQWYFNSVTIPGATSANHIINPTTPDNSGAYRVVITNAYGATTSAVATLTLTNASPNITTAYAFDLSPGGTLIIPPSALISNDVSGPCVAPITELTFLSFSPTSANGGTLTSTAPGIPLWTNRYSSAGFFDDQATSMAVDRDGNVIVTGHAHGSGTYEDYVTLKYSGTGTPLWTNIHTGLANSGGRKGMIAVNGAGTVFITVIHPDDFATVAYSTSGVALWTNYYNGPGNNQDGAQAVTVDASGNVFVTGYSRGSFSDDFATVAYSEAGVPLWTNRYEGPGFYDDVANAVAVGANGNVFVAGYSYGEETGEDYATIAYTAAGIPLWTNRFNGLGDENVGSNDRALAIAVAPDGTVIVTGNACDAGGITEFATLAYSETGQPLWTNRYHGPSPNSDRAMYVAVNANGIVAVTGESLGSSGFPNYDYATVAYALDGAPLWTNRYNGPANNIDSAAAIRADAADNFFVTGGSMLFGSSVAWDYATISYGASGIPLWTNRFNGTANWYDRATALAVDRAGNVFVSGFATMQFSAQDFVTIAYSGSQISYTPTNGFTGIDTFTYVMQDGYGLNHTGTVSVAIGVVANTISTEVLPGGEVQLGFYGTPGQPYALERIFDLTSNAWTPQQTNTAAANGALSFTNLPAGSANFWRIRSLP